MRIDENGAWIDPGAIGPIHGYPSEETEVDNTEDETVEEAEPSDTVNEDNET